MGRPVARLMISRLKLRVFLEAEWVHKNACGRISAEIIMRTILQEEETIHHNITIWYTNLSLCLKPWRFPQQKQQWTRKGKKWRNFLRGTWRKSEARKRWSMKQGRRAQKFILPHFTDVRMSSERMLNWRQKHQKYKMSICISEVMLCNIILDLTQYSPNKDHQLLKWQQLKSSDILSRLPGCDGQAADAVSAETQVKMEDAHKLLKIPKIGVSRHLDSSTTTQMATSHGPVLKTQLFLLNGICTVILWQDCYGKGNSRKSYWNMAGRKFQIGNVSLYMVKKDYSYLCMWMTKKWLQRKHWSDVESTKQRSRVGRTNIIPRSCVLGVHSKTMWNK